MASGEGLSRSTSGKSAVACVLLFAAMGLLAASSGCSQEKKIASNIEVLKDKKSKPEARLSAAKSLARIGEPAIPALIDVMKPEYRHALYEIGYAFGGMGPAAVPALIEALGHEEPYVRMLSATVLPACSPTTRAVAPLMSILEKDEYQVRAAAAIALQHFGAAAGPAVPGLIDLAQHKDPQARDVAIAALKQIDPAALELFPQPIEEGGVLAKSFKARSQRDFEQIVFRIGVLEYRRFDMNRDWKLTAKEISGHNALSLEKHDFNKDGHLTFAEAGDAAYRSCLMGYKAGAKIDDPTWKKKMQQWSFRKGVAIMLEGDLRLYDKDGDGMLSHQEYGVWAGRTQLLTLIDKVLPEREEKPGN